MLEDCGQLAIASGSCAGFMGLSPVSFEADFTPAVEMGSFTATANLRSRRVMEKLQLRHQGGMTSNSPVYLREIRCAGRCSTASARPSGSSWRRRGELAALPV